APAVSYDDAHVGDIEAFSLRVYTDVIACAQAAQDAPVDEARGHKDDSPLLLRYSGQDRRSVGLPVERLHCTPHLFPTAPTCHSTRSARGAPARKEVPS